MNKNKNVFFCRSNSINPEPRLMKAARWIKNSEKINYNIKACGWDRDGKERPEENVDGIIIERINIKGFYGQGIKKNLVGIIYFNLVLLFKLLFQKVDIVHAADLDTALPAIFASKIKNVKVIYDIYDFYSDTHSLGKMDNLIRLIERWVIKQADLTIIADERRICQLGIEKEVVENKLLVIYNTPDDVTDINNYISNKKKNILTISYVGVLSNDRNIIETIHAVQGNENIHFVIAGYGILENEIKNLQSTNIEFLGKVNYKTALEIERNSDIILAMYNPEILNNKYAAPNKLCEGMMLSRPVVTSEGTLCAAVLDEEKIGYILPYGESDIMKEFLAQLIVSKNEICEKGQRARKLYDEKYSAKKMCDRLQNAYIKILGED